MLENANLGIQPTAVGVFLNAEGAHDGVMSEESEVDPGAGDGLIFHEGSRLTDLKIKQSLSIDYPRLEPLHHLKIELMFHFFKIRTFSLNKFFRFIF